MYNLSIVSTTNCRLAQRTLARRRSTLHKIALLPIFSPTTSAGLTGASKARKAARTEINRPAVKQAAPTDVEVFSSI